MIMSYPRQNPFKDQDQDQAPAPRATRVQLAPFDVAPEDTILRIKKHFGGERVYTYSLVKAGGRWYVTGQVHAGKGLTAEKVFQFLTEGYLVSVELAVAFQTIEV